MGQGQYPVGTIEVDLVRDGERVEAEAIVLEAWSYGVTGVILHFNVDDGTSFQVHMDREHATEFARMCRVALGHEEPRNYDYGNWPFGRPRVELPGNDESHARRQPLALVTDTKAERTGHPHTKGAGDE